MTKRLSSIVEFWGERKVYSEAAIGELKHAIASPAPAPAPASQVPPQLLHLLHSYSVLMLQHGRRTVVVPLCKMGLPSLLQYCFTDALWKCGSGLPAAICAARSAMGSPAAARGRISGSCTAAAFLRRPLWRPLPGAAPWGFKVTKITKSNEKGCKG